MPELPAQKSKPAIAVRHRPLSPIPYAELHVTSNFSFLRGASHPEELISRAAELGCHALALTDINSLAGIVRAHVAAKEAQIPFLVGCHLQLTDDEHDEIPMTNDESNPNAQMPNDQSKKPIRSQTPLPFPSFVIRHSNLSLLVYPTDRASYGRLSRMLTHGKRRTAKGHCDLTLQDVITHQEGLLAIILPPPLLEPDFITTLHHLQEIFTDGRLSLAASCLYNGLDAGRLEQLAALARETAIPLVATNDVHYHIPQRQPLQDVLTCIRLGCTIEEAGFALFANAERHLKGPEEMGRLFCDHPAAIERTREIAQRAAAFSLNQLKYEYPHEICPSGKTLMQHLKDRTWAGALERYGSSPAVSGGACRAINASCASGASSAEQAPPLTNIPQSIRDRIEHEFRLIEELDYPAYFLTVDDIVTFARSRGILCQGRGAAANSAVCYCLGITAVDPARIDLLVERFISKERDEPPDIDIDFEHERREEVIQYLYNKYGRDRAALTAEVISYRRRSAVREVGKAMGLSLDCVDRLAKSGDWWENAVLSEPRLREMGFNPFDPVIRRTVALAQELIGFPRHLSQHVGGFVLSRGPLCESVPIENASMPDRTVIEWDKDDIDALGMLKVDVLGLGMLTAIRKAMDLVNHWNDETLMTNDQNKRLRKVGDGSAGPPDFSHSSFLSLEFDLSFVIRHLNLQFHTIPPEDPAVYDMLCNADSIGVFQVESRAQMTMLPRLKPRCYYDLVIEVAIVRPGPIQGGMVHPYLEKRNAEEPITYPSEAVRQVLGRTLGVPLFQEQAMRLVMVAAGFTAGEADQLRRAMAAWKKKGDLIHRFGEKIITGMTANGYTMAYAQRVVEQIKGFSEYGFPESHAASFALLVYVSAWLKRHHPAAFAAALINSQPMGFYQPAQIVRDAANHGVKVLPVDVNFSGWDCRLQTNDETRMTNDESNPNVQMTNDQNKMLGAMPCGAGSLLGMLNVQSPTNCVRSDHRFGHSSFDHSDLIRHSSFVICHFPPALRLGLRLVTGLRETEARKIEDAVANCGPFKTITALWRASSVRVATLRTLAAADAFTSMGLDRQQALWSVSRLRDDILPMFDQLECVIDPDDRAALPAISPQQLVVHDYAATGLSLKAHPISFVREQLNRLAVTPAHELADEKMSPHGRGLAVAGMVLVRQRPSTAAGILFVTLEDETGIANLVVRPAIYDRYRAALRHNVCLIVWGKVERQGQVVHVLVERASDLASAAGRAPSVKAVSRDFH